MLNIFLKVTQLISDRIMIPAQAIWLESSSYPHTPPPLVKHTSGVGFQSSCWHTSHIPGPETHLRGTKLTSQWMGLPMLSHFREVRTGWHFSCCFSLCVSWSVPMGLQESPWCLGLPISCSLPGLLLPGNSFLASGFSSNISPFWKPDPIDTLALCFYSTLNNHLTEKHLWHDIIMIDWHLHCPSEVHAPWGWG